MKQIKGNILDVTDGIIVKQLPRYKEKGWFILNVDKTEGQHGL